MAVLLACVNDVGTEPDTRAGETASLALRAQVQALGTAVGPYSVLVSVSYEAAGEALEPLPASPDSIALGEGGTELEQRLEVELEPCLGDGARAQAESGGCVVWITLRLRDPGDVLAEESVNLGVVRPGDQVISPAAIILVPRYTLSIGGGGEGTGSGVVTVPAAADQPALTCEITDGTAAPTGCSARYPLHTSVTLSVAEGTLEAWGDECQEVAASSPCELTLDAHRGASARFTVPATTGDLLVQIAGLPEGTPAQVTVTNERGYRQDLTETTRLTALAPGDDYRVTAVPVMDAEERTYTPTPADQPASVVAGEVGTTQIGYNLPETGGLAVAVLGLPEGVDARVSVTGPSLEVPLELTAGTTLTGLDPGSYTISAEDVETSDQVFAPTPVVSTSPVEAGATTHDTVTYAPTRGALVVSVSGLPDGVQAAITVTGPNFSRSLTGTETLLKLPAGPYQVAAENVRVVEGRTFAPTPPTQPAPVAAGATTVASIGYGVLRAARLVKITADGVTCFVNTFCEDLFAVQAYDAAGFAVADARIRWTALNPTQGCPEGSHTDVSTDLQGIARASNQCRYPTPGTYSQSATIVIDGEPVPSTAVTFTFTLTPTPDESSVETSLDTVRTCCDTAVVTVTARDARGGPLAGRSVVLEATGGALSVVQQPSAPTGPDGVATGRVVGRLIGAASVTASIDGVPIDQAATIAVTAGIVFADAGDIYAMTQGGTRPVNLTRGAFLRARSPAWSPDGSRLAFVGDTCFDGGDCLSGVYVTNADGTGELEVTGRLVDDAQDPTWSPDGRSIAFHSDPCNGDGLCQRIWVVQSTGSTPIPITPEGSSARWPDWSPDGTRIVFVSVTCPEDCVTTLQTMDSKGGSRVPLSTAFQSGDFPADPRWSPDGARIAFTLFTCGDGCIQDIAVVSSTGSNLVNLTAGLENNAAHPAWSPGGGRIAFTYDRCNDGCDEITLMSSRDGADLTPLHDGSDPHWR